MRPQLLSLLVVLTLALGVTASAQQPTLHLSSVQRPTLQQSSAQQSSAHPRYWVYFTDRGADVGERLHGATPEALGISAAALERRVAALPAEAPAALRKRAAALQLEDLPPAPMYLRALEAEGAVIHTQSRWFNAVSVEADAAQRARLAALPFVDRVEPVRRFTRVLPEPQFMDKQAGSLSSYGLDYGNALRQLELIRVPEVHDLWVDGTGIIVGMLDNGFRWRPHEALSGLKVRGEYDFIFQDSLTENEAIDLYGQDAHGTVTFSALGGFKPGVLIGPAFNSEFFLGKTEKNGSETQIEEDYWVQGIEWLESRGASIVSASLGYLDWDDGTGYSWAAGDLDGRTAVTSRAAVEAMRRGVVVVTAMGNEGPMPATIIAPADADSIIAVGAVNYEKGVAGFSSRGPTSDQRIKPDVCAPGVSVFCANKAGANTYEYASGTSLATPLAAGAAALLRSVRPELTPVNVRDLLRATADRAASPDNARGWGLIDTWEAVLSSGLVISTNPKIFWSGNASTIMAWVVSKDPVDAFGVRLTYEANGIGRTIEMAKIRDYDGLGPGAGLYSGVIDGVAAGTDVRFFIRASDSRETRTSPYGIPEHMHHFTSGESRTLGAEHLMPTEFALEESLPNPWITADGGTAIINFAVPLPGAGIRLRLHDGLGRVIRTLAEGFRGAGLHSVAVDDRGLSTGVYYYSLDAGDRQIMRRLVVVK